ncbi:DNA polymerase III subunit delta [Zooshikella marina]|uniref:DNA polymerase III subunit delta n=1 Tax=Zooshikella ganghwensis TaxID=202772 RepID=A0A4P9VKE9_9GAMM|nr:DNA polymerase III subunit delta [Zooshikella ganghwensis]MBU2708392.1 DNA polymerase III subunit delta [Zooshikella ganghwensis]RDH42630.1 DNA polymerase III subunit delta [Zooshikella ganghwensis]
MKIRNDQLQQHLAQNTLAPIYIVSGDEPLIQQECCDLIRQKARDKGFNERILLQVDGNFDWETLQEHTNSLSLFSDKKIIEVRCQNNKFNEKASKILKACGESPILDNVLLLITPKLESATQQSKWFKALEKSGIFIPIWPIDAQHLPRWIKQRMQQAGLTATTQAIQLLTERVEGNLLAASQEIAKLTLYAENQHVTEETINACVADSARYSVFDLIENALAGSINHCLRIFNGLKAEGIEPAVMLWAITREVRTLLQLIQLQREGHSLEQAMQNQRIWEKRKPLIRQALKRNSEQSLEQILMSAGQVDEAIKGLSEDNIWSSLQFLLLKLVGVSVTQDFPQ